LLVVLLWPLIVADGALRTGEQWLPPSGGARYHAERALQTQRYTLDHLANLPRLERCGWVAWLGYERNDGSPLSDAWYNATQLMADAALARLGQRSHACVQRKAAAFLELVRAPVPPGGFWPRADVDGRNLSSADLYADDNALIGLALLEARAASDDRTWRARLLDQARHAAALLTDSGLWDETFGGGFWWNSRRGRMGEGKPAQTTALAAQLFLRLYEATDDRAYAVWARRSLTWLDARLVDPTTGLYVFAVRHWDMPNQRGEHRDPRLFAYDQGIMIEVLVLYDRLVEPDAGHLDRARSLAAMLDPAFWDQQLGGYRIATDRPDISAGFGAWLTQSLLALQAADGDPFWLERAAANLEALDRHLRDPRDFSYANLYYPCLDRALEGCRQGQRWSYDPTRYLVSQAWMQRAHALMAAGLLDAGVERARPARPRER
jgi:uncharacterized protein YyaL (SSP411 family)